MWKDGILAPRPEPTALASSGRESPVGITLIGKNQRTHGRAGQINHSDAQPAHHLQGFAQLLPLQAKEPMVGKDLRRGHI